MKRMFFLLCLLVSPALEAQPAADALRAAIDHPERSAKDRERDTRDQSEQVLRFAGVKPGMKVLDVFGGGGYYSELLAYVVGTDGQVTLLNNPSYRSFAGDDYKTRFADGRLKVIEQRVVETGYMRLPDATYDLAIIVMSYHDLYYIDEASGWPAIDVKRFFQQLHRSLKRGGHLLIIDHAARAGSGSTAAQDLHRIDEQFAIRDITSRGFVLAKTWDGLRNPADAFDKLVFDPAVRGKTDRFVHLYRKR